MAHESFFGIRRFLAGAADKKDAQRDAGADERIVTAVAVSAAVLVVASIALLMGTVGP